jgi:phosphohistidine swiveling domain-containing protein
MHKNWRPILFTGDVDPVTIEEVGGKAYSLIRLCGAGLPVPPGCVLPTTFFDPWYASLRETDAWHTLAASEYAATDSIVRALQDHCMTLLYSPVQQEGLEESLRRLGPGTGLWAVRSSSPAEDLGEASFAGLYRTEIGVPTAELEGAIRRVFASCFEQRVLSYRPWNSRGPETPQMAVIVQEMIPADVSGIAFSANPVNNSREEVVINAAWGLGESIVSGQTSPDELVLAKSGTSLHRRKTGAKETALFLDPDGALRNRHGYRSDEFCLETPDAVVLRDLVCRVEELYGWPVDVEWALRDGEILLLQARPITTLVPLPESLRILGEEPGRMYLDLTLVEHGMQGALSPLGSSWMDHVLGYTLEALTGNPRVGRDAVRGIAQEADGRMYLNVSNLLWIMKPKMIALLFGGLDASSAGIIRACDPREWRSPVRPPLLGGITAASLWQSRDLLLHAARGFVSPDAVARECRVSADAFVAALEDLETQDLSFTDFCEEAGRMIVWWVKEKSGSTLINSECARMVIRRMFAGAPDDCRTLADMVDRALPNNRTTEMALSLSRLSHHAGSAVFEDETILAERIRRKDMPDAFMAEWTSFMETYGFRGPREIDPASPGYEGHPRLVLAQLRNYAEASRQGHGPAARFEEERRRREEACRLLQTFCRTKGRLWEQLFLRMYALIDTFGGIREDHKYYLVLVTSRVRRRALAAGERLAARGQIHAPEDVFCLSLPDCQSALDHPDMMMHRTVAENRGRFGMMDAVRRYPPVIDSTGRILHPPAQVAGDSEIRGYGVSAGTARGQVRVLHHPAEKEVHPGDILVISASDPGWTPLFLTAGGVVLEVGGLLQHGSIIAREYGIPCVVGVIRATEIFKDGQLVEIDGGSGIVRLLPSDIRTDGKRPPP